MKHVDSHCTCGRRGTWWHGCAKKWYELDCFITNIPITPGSWSRLNTFTMDGADHMPATKASRIKKFEEKEKEEEVWRRIRWDKTRGGSQWAGDKKEEYRVALEERVEEMDETASCKELAGTMRQPRMKSAENSRDQVTYHSHSKVRRGQLLQDPRMQKSAKRD